MRSSRAHGSTTRTSRPPRERNWGTYSLFAMWMSDVHSIGGYTFAAGLFFTGLVGWQVFVALVLGITVVFFLMNLTGFAGPGHRCALPGDRPHLVRCLRRQSRRADPGGDRHRVVRHPDLAGLAGRGRARDRGVARPRRAPRRELPRPRRARLGGVRGAVGAAAAGHPARHGDRAAVPGLGGPGDLGRDVRARRRGSWSTPARTSR